MSLFSHRGTFDHITRLHLFFDSFRRILRRRPVSMSTINSRIKYSERIEVMEFIFELSAPSLPENEDRASDDNPSSADPDIRKAAFQMPLIEYERAYVEFFNEDSFISNEYAATRVVFLTALRFYLMCIMAELATFESLIPRRIRVKARDGLEWELRLIFTGGHISTDDGSH